MSWSIAFTGKPKAVAAKIREYAADGTKCAEPEESVRQKVLEGAAIAAENHADGYAVEVTAAGSMWRDAQGVRTNNVTMAVRTLNGFVD